jgi:hypothetical protein
MLPYAPISSQCLLVGRTKHSDHTPLAYVCVVWPALGTPARGEWCSWPALVVWCGGGLSVVVFMAGWHGTEWRCVQYVRPGVGGEAVGFFVVGSIS